MTENDLIKITDRIINDGYLLSYEEAVAITGFNGNINTLFLCSDRIRQAFSHDNVFLCSILNAKSGKCSQDCAFCAQSSFHKAHIDTYSLMDMDTLTGKAFEMQRTGATHYSIVTSGHSLSESEIDRICKAVEVIRRDTELVVCGSLGMLSEQSAKKLIASGMTRYHHNLETARSHFDSICSTHRYDEDLDTIRTAAANGFKVCSGGIFGLGETWSQRVELAFTIKELEVDTIPVNFLNPVPGTRLESLDRLAPMEALKCIALFRLIHPDKSITVCGGREVVLKDYQSWVYKAGANGLMIGNYLTTSGRDAETDIEMTVAAGLKTHRMDASGQ